MEPVGAFQFPTNHNPVAAAWPPIVGPNAAVVNLNMALAVAGPFMSRDERARANEILAALNPNLSTEERGVLQHMSGGLSPATYSFHAADASCRIKHVVETLNFLTGQCFTACIRRDLLGIANRIEGRFGVPFVGTLDVA